MKKFLWEELNYKTLTFFIFFSFFFFRTSFCHGCTCVPHPEPPSNLPPPSHPSGLSQYTCFECPVSFIELRLVIYFTYGNTYVSILFSQIIPPSPSPTESKSLLFISVSLLLSCMQGRCYHLSKFHVYVLIYCISIFLSDLLYSV